jgi:hypothetical protein
LWDTAYIKGFTSADKNLLEHMFKNGTKKKSVTKNGKRKCCKVNKDNNVEVVSYIKFSTAFFNILEVYFLSVNLQGITPSPHQF